MTSLLDFFDSFFPLNLYGTTTHSISQKVGANGEFITTISDAYEMTSLPDRLCFVFRTIFQLYIAPVPILLYQGVGEGQGTGRVGNFVAEPMKSQVQLICFIFLCAYVPFIPEGKGRVGNFVYFLFFIATI